LGRQALCIAKNGETRIYAKDLEDGSKAVGLFNTSSNETATIMVKWSDLKLSGKQTVRDLWRQKNLGSSAANLELKVAPHGAELIRLSGSRN
jgi:alpha-galactosidase